MIPIADSEELVRKSGLPDSALIAVGSNHRLADPEPLKAMLEAVERASNCSAAGKTSIIKGQCEECSRYHCCPRMKGGEICYGLIEVIE